MFLSYHPEIVSSYYNWQTWYACKWSRSKVTVTEVKANFPQFRRFRIIIQFEFTNGYQIIHIAWNRKEKKNCLIVFQGYLSNFKVAEDKYFAGFFTQIGRYELQLLFELIVGYKWRTKRERAKQRYSVVSQGHPSNLKFTRDIKSSILTRIGRFRTVTPLEFTYGYKLMHKAWSSIEEVAYCFLGHPTNFKLTRDIR